MLQNYTIVSIDGADPRTAERLYAITLDANQRPTTWKVSSFQNELDNENNRYLACQIDGELVGYLGFMVVLDEVSINNFAVLTTYKQIGIGSALMRHMLAECQKQGAKNVFLEVRTSNRGAISLYKKLGFEQLSYRKNYYVDPVEDAYVFHLGIEEVNG